MDSVLAAILCFAGNFAPKGWALCNGQLLAISTNQALFSLLGTTYGGDGRTTFALPDLRGRTPVGTGQGPGLSNYTLGEKIGAETVTLISANVPVHQHVGNTNFYLQCDSQPGADPGVEFAYPANFTSGYATSPTANTTMLAPAYTGTINPAGGGLPVPILEPYLVLNFIIALQGIFPSRN